MSWLDTLLGRSGSDEEPSRPAAGSVWAGPRTYTTDPLIGRPGYYALSDDGRTILEPHILLTHVNVDPRNEEDTRGIWLVADPDEPYFSHQPPHENPPNVVELEAESRGSGKVSVGE